MDFGMQFGFLELRGCSMFLFLTVPIFDKMQEGRGAKFINFGNEYFEEKRPVQSDLLILCCVAGSRERRQRQNVFMKVTRYDAQTTL